MTVACPHCERVFVRGEHLTRHIDSVHNRARFFACDVCGKEFNRSDSCRRHQQSHKRPGSRSIKNLRGDRTRRACRACAAARVKCSGGETCKRCLEKQIECNYILDQPQQKSTAISDVSMESSQEIRGNASRVADMTAETCQDVLPTPDSDVVLPDFALPLAEQETRERATVLQLLSAAQQRPFNQNIHPSPEHIPWCDNINWLPVSNDFDLSMLGDFESTAAVPLSAWTAPGNMDISSPLTSLSYSTGRSASEGRRRRQSESRYIDGNGARKSLQKASKLPRAPVEASWLRSDAYAFPQSALHTAGGLPSENDGINQQSFTTIFGHFQSLCVSGAAFWKPFESTMFPSRDHLGRCFDLYLEHHLPHLPFQHNTFWSQQPAPWPVLLACITIGSSFDADPAAHEITHAFREFLRRAVRWCLEADTALDRSTLAQTCLLNAVAQFNSLSEDNALSAVADLKLAMKLFQRSYRRQPIEQIDHTQTELLWAAWVQEEAQKRLWWFAWLVETMINMSRYQDGPSKLSSGVVHLPCASARWEAATSWAWSSLPEDVQQTTELVNSLHSLYVKHKMPALLDSTQNILLTYAIVASTEEVASAVLKALHNWTPTPADGEEGSEGESVEVSSKEQWLPANSDYAAWRNSACDCLDLLHWKANSDVASARGFEGPAILHLHLSRLLLLCPYRDFIALAIKLTKQAMSSSDSCSATHLSGNILKWLTLDDHKGRLSLVHAGSIYWYARRYSLALFFEPIAIYVSTISLWTYSLYLPQVRGVLLNVKESRQQQQSNRTDQSRPGSSNESEDDDLTPRTILLDRPCDDEIVQAFVRRGHEMTAEMCGAGDICTPQGRRRVLEEGMRLLRRSQYGGYDKARQWSHILQKLAHCT